MRNTGGIERGRCLLFTSTITVGGASQTDDQALPAWLQKWQALIEHALVVDQLREGTAEQLLAERQPLPIGPALGHDVVVQRVVRML